MLLANKWSLRNLLPTNGHIQGPGKLDTFLPTDNKTSLNGSRQLGSLCSFLEETELQLPNFPNEHTALKIEKLSYMDTQRLNYPMENVTVLSLKRLY